MKKSLTRHLRVKKPLKFSTRFQIFQGPGHSDLSKKLQIGKSTVHGITTALGEMGIRFATLFTTVYRRLQPPGTLQDGPNGKLELKDWPGSLWQKLMERVARPFSGRFERRSRHHCRYGGSPKRNEDYLSSGDEATPFLRDPPEGSSFPEEREKLER